MATPLKWKFRELIIALGGPQAVIREIAKYGVEPPPRDTVKGWQTRGSIPPQWVPLLIMIAQKKGLLRDIASLWDRTP